MSQKITENGNETHPYRLGGILVCCLGNSPVCATFAAAQEYNEYCPDYLEALACSASLLSAASLLGDAVSLRSLCHCSLLLSLWRVTLALVGGGDCVYSRIRC